MVSTESPVVNRVDEAAHWELLKDRLIDEITNSGMTMERITVEIGQGLMVDHLQHWAADIAWGRDPSRYVGEVSRAEWIESLLTSYFSELDHERAESQRQAPGRIVTSVMETVLGGFAMARTAPAMVDICVPAGAGKTQAMEEYVNQCRKREGIDCPVWTIGLSEFGLTVKSILTLIAAQVDNRFRHRAGLNDFEIDSLIVEKTQGQGGLLIIDEAQHLADAKLDHGIRIVNGLRRYVDQGLFGIALLNNGEVYRRISGGKHAQLVSRMKEWRVEAAGVTEQDVDLVAASWGISGKEARAWCINKAKGPGQLRALVSAFKRAQMEYGEITLAALLRKG